MFSSEIFFVPSSMTVAWLKFVTASAAEILKVLPNRTAINGETTERGFATISCKGTEKRDKTRNGRCQQLIRSNAKCEEEFVDTPR